MCVFKTQMKKIQRHMEKVRGRAAPVPGGRGGICQTCPDRGKRIRRFREAMSGILPARSWVFQLV